MSVVFKNDELPLYKTTQFCLSFLRDVFFFHVLILLKSRGRFLLAYRKRFIFFMERVPFDM